MSLRRGSSPGCLMWAVGLFFGMITARACAQQPDAQEDHGPAEPYTLHVYQHVVQVPTLVLTRQRAIENTWRAADFRISLDAGPLFAPLRVRQEGGDPLSLAVVVDAGGGVPEQVVEEFTETLSAQAPMLFTRDDRIRFFALSCDLTESRELSPGIAGEAKSLEKITRIVLAKSARRGLDANETECMSHRVWDALEVVTEQIAKTPGRHVVILLTDGIDGGSRSSWREAVDYADTHATAIFGLRWGEPHPSEAVEVPSSRGGRLKRLREDPFDLLTGGTGGLVKQVGVGQLAADLAELMTMVRSRYVLEFQRPQNSTKGLHQIVVTVPDRDAVVLATGVGVALEDAAIRDDPSTVPSDTSHAPELGTRRVLTHP